MIPVKKYSSVALFASVLLFLLIPLCVSAVDIYWENSEVLVPENGRFHSAAFGGGNTVVIWHEFIKQGPENGIVYISLASSKNGKEWLRNERFAGPFNYNGDEVPVCSLTVKNNGDIYVSVSADENTVKIYSSGDNGKTFNEITRKTSFTMTVGPRLFIKEDGTFIMFVTKESGNNLSIFYARSDTGETWSDFSQLVPEPGLELNFLPQFVSKGGVEYVVFQSFLVQRRSTYQLYLKKSTDGGNSWSEAKRITDFDERINGRTVESADFDNQRPDFKIDDSTIHLAWERRNISEANPQIYYVKLDLDGNPKEDPEKVSADGRTCNYPKIAKYKGNIFITWFDNRMGDYHVIISDFNGILWRDKDISLMEGDSIFSQPVEAYGSLYILWENIRNNKSRIVMLSPDTSVESPVITPLNFLSSRKSSGDTYSFSWNLPNDASGIAGFSYSAGRSRFGSPPRKITNTSRQLKGDVDIEEDGQWYIYLAASDYAGNWSETSVIPVYRDTVPPGPVSFEKMEKDETGFVKSNTFRIMWQPPAGEPVEGFVYNLQLIDENYRRDTEESVLLKRVKPPEKENRNPYPYLAYSNLDNGIWGVSVSAVDEAGNISKPSAKLFKLNKYIPVTIISSIDPVVDQLNRITISIKGRGFTAGGSIRTIHLDRDGKEPWDYSFYLADNSYKIVNDRTITDFTVSDILEGVYSIALDHPRRGLYITKPVIKLEPSGTVKLGYFVSGREPVWKPVRKKLFTFNAGLAGIYLVLIICALAVAVSAYRLRAVWTEGQMLRKDIDAIMKGIPLSYRERKERITVMKRKGMGLRLKFTLFVIFIVLAVVIMVALPLGRFMLETQRKNLVTALRQQSEVLLESLTSGARSYLPASNTLELGLLPAQREAMADAVFVTIAGKSSESGSGYDYVWASDDRNIYSKIDSQELIPGKYRISDAISALSETLQKNIDEEASGRVSVLAQEVEKLGQEARALIGRGGNETALQDLQNRIRDLDQQIQKILKEIGSGIRVYPQFDAESGSLEDAVYTFYKPVIYRQSGENIYYRGLVRLGVSTSGILSEIRNSNDFLIKQTLIIAAGAILFGMAGALILSSIIISPIKKLVLGLEKIRDTEDKETLKDHLITVKSRDELYILAETINEMTQGLAKAAAASKDLTLGKEIQKMFIPLEKDSHGKKLTTGKESSENFEFFGYYEGAKGVSGDYFDYVKLDEENYALIKCDVSGKGVPASLIMVEVATIFTNYFRHWKPGSRVNLPEVIININDMLEERGFQGRFATLIVVVINIKNGDCYLCNAGDNIVHLYNSRENRMKQITLPESPASGVFSSVMVGDKFQQVKMKLEKNDALLLFTDGVEEAKRKFRNSNFELINCAEPGMKDGDLHGNHYVSAGDEEFGLPRIYDLLNALYSRSIYTLEKYHNPVSDEVQSFDFSSCTGTIEEAVLALVSVERIFRLYTDPTATSENRIQIDNKINGFLKEHFEQYRRYFSNPVENKEGQEYTVFTNLKQDDQYDDLTILAFRRK